MDPSSYFKDIPAISRPGIPEELGKIIDSLSSLDPIVLKLSREESMKKLGEIYRGSILVNTINTTSGQRRIRQISVVENFLKEAKSANYADEFVFI